MIPCSIGGIEYTETSLWTNSAPTSAFAAQDVTLIDNVDKFKYIKVSYRVSTSNSEVSSAIILVADLKNTDAFSRSGLTYGSISGNGYKVRDYYYVDNVTIGFTAGYQINAAATDNNSCIPTEILGLNELDVGKTSKVLLWLNPDPSSSSGFAAQTLSIDLSDYEAVIIRCSMGKDYNTDTQKPYQLFNYVPKDGITHYIGSLLNSSGTTSANWGRQVTVTDSGITFSTAGYPASTLASNNAGMIIPIEIYGLKYTEPTYPDDPRKFILKNGVFQGTQGTDYGVVGTLTQTTGYVTISSGSYTTGIAPFISATDKTKYKRLVFDSDCKTSRLYSATTETGSRTYLNLGNTYALNLDTLSNDIFVYLMPGSESMNYYNIYLE